MTHQSYAYVFNQENRKFMCIQNLYINVHDGLFGVTKDWKQPKCPLIVERIIKL